METKTTTASPAGPMALRCGFCFDRENGKHGEVRREWSEAWKQYIQVCRKHAARAVDSAEQAAIDDKANPSASFEWE